MPGYQSFPFQAGASNSLDKLVKLRIPPLTGKKFLDVGCNDGYFCGYAFYDCAQKVVGIDINAKSIQTAKSLFPDCTFLEQGWDCLPEEQFDVILCSSALHYANDQEDLIHRLLQKIRKDGVLILEVGVAEGNDAKWVEIKRSIDTRVFPTRAKLHEILNAYAWKHMGTGTQQIGDPLPRFVYHVRPKKPYAFLLIQPPAAGKSMILRETFKTQKRISGDNMLRRISTGKVDCNENLRIQLDKRFNPDRLDNSIEFLFRSGLWVEFWASILEQADGMTFAYDGYVPEQYHEQVKDFLKQQGYLPVSLEWNNPHQLGNLGVHSKTEARKYQMYLTALLGQKRR